jgi:serine protease AprX
VKKRPIEHLGIAAAIGGTLFSLLISCFLPASTASIPAAGGGAAIPIYTYVSGRSGGSQRMAALPGQPAAGAVDAGLAKYDGLTTGQGVSPAVGTAAKTMLFDGSTAAPAPYPQALSEDGTQYMLCGKGAGLFWLYQYDHEDANYIYYVSVSRWDFSAFTNYVNSILYKGKPTAWIVSPFYSSARRTLYVTICFWVEHAAKGDYVKVRIYESALSGNAFQTPQELRGEINPYHPAHYQNGQWHTPDDFPGRLGFWWIGRMYVTGDGKKAYFNCLNVDGSKDIMKSSSPFLAPIPNRQDLGLSGITDLHDPRLIDTYVCSAEIAADGSFFNVKQLPPAINRGGINFVCDVTADGTTLSVAQMTCDATFWSYGWGPDGLALECTMHPASELEPWTGTINAYYDPDFPYPMGADLRTADLSAFDLHTKLDQLMTCSFGAATVWPSAARMPAGFDPAGIIAWGKAPGLGLAQLHAQGYTGAGVRVGYCDQPLLLTHEALQGKNITYDKVWASDSGMNSPSMHGPAVASLLLGNGIGAAPDVKLDFVAFPSWRRDQQAHADAIYKLIAINQTLPANDKIRILGFSDAVDETEANPEAFRAAIQAAEAQGIWVFIVGTLSVARAKISPFLDKDGYANWSAIGDGGNNQLLIPAGGRTTAVGYQNDNSQYDYWASGGASWTIPYLVGVLAIGLQLDPTLTKEEAVQYLFDTGYPCDKGKIINPQGFVQKVLANKS